MNEQEALVTLIYDESVRSIRDQAAALDSLRTRAGMLITTSAVVTAFFGSIAIGDPPSLHGWSWLAAGMFAGVVACALAIVWPLRRWAFTANPDVLIKYMDASADVTSARERMLRHVPDTYKENQDKLDWLYRLFALACLLLAVEVVTWGVAIIRGGQR